MPDSERSKTPTAAPRDPKPHNEPTDPNEVAPRNPHGHDVGPPEEAKKQAPAEERAGLDLADEGNI